MSQKVNFIIGNNDRKIAYCKVVGSGSTVIFCGGFMSDMEGTKALYLEKICQELKLSYIRFDYSGHGRSSENFIEGTIGKWADDTLAVIDQLTSGPILIIGSSMGGWIGLLASLARKQRVIGFIGIAAAPDFTRSLMWDKYSDDIKGILENDGIYLEPSEYSDSPYQISYNLIQEGDNHLLLDKKIELDCPIRLFHGLKDADVPYELSLNIADKITSNDVIISFNKHGDHRLSSETDLERLRRAVIELT